MESDTVSSVHINFGNKIECEELCDLLKQREINEFAATLQWIKNTESLLLSSEIPHTVLTVLENDLLLLCGKEKEIGEDWALLNGHGIIERLASALQITYFASPFYFIKSEEEKKAIRTAHRWLTSPKSTENINTSNNYSLAKVNRAFLTLQRTPWEEILPTTSQLLPDQMVDESNPSKSWTSNIDGDQISKNIIYSLELHPPVPMSVHFHWLSSVSISTSSGFSEGNNPVETSLLNLLMKRSSSSSKLFVDNNQREFNLVINNCLFFIFFFSNLLL